MVVQPTSRLFHLGKLKPYTHKHHLPFPPAPSPGNNHSTYCLYEFDHCRYLMLSPSQVCLPDVQRAKRWDAEVCTRERVYSRGQKTGELISAPPPWRQGPRGIYGIKKQGGLRCGECGERGLEIRKRWGSRPSALVQVQLSYRLPHETYV